MEEELGILNIANIVMENQIEESKAIIDYTSLLGKIEKCFMDEIEKEKAMNIIGEIIADELNHQIKLGKLYSDLTEINAKGD